jgi:hypothetical protein
MWNYWSLVLTVIIILIYIQAALHSKIKSDCEITLTLLAFYII